MNEQINNADQTRRAINLKTTNGANLKTYTNLVIMTMNRSTTQANSHRQCHGHSADYDADKPVQSRIMFTV